MIIIFKVLDIGRGGDGGWGDILIPNNAQSPMPNYQLPITYYQLPIPNAQSPITN